MSFASPIRAAMRDRIPAATHADGSARFQSLVPATGTSLRTVVEAFHRRTGVPCVINTSLNCEGPIAATPADAVACLQRAELDALVLGPYLLELERGASG
jgi:carbamoyltransferase